MPNSRPNINIFPLKKMLGQQEYESHNLNFENKLSCAGNGSVKPSWQNSWGVFQIEAKMPTLYANAANETHNTKSRWTIRPTSRTFSALLSYQRGIEGSDVRSSGCFPVWKLESTICNWKNHLCVHLCCLECAGNVKVFYAPFTRSSASRSTCVHRFGSPYFRRRQSQGQILST